MISRCPSCAAQVADDASRCPSCHWDFLQFKKIPPAGEAHNPTVAPKGAPPPEPPKLPPAKSLPPPPTSDPNAMHKMRVRQEPSQPMLHKPKTAAPPPADGGFKIPTFKGASPPPPPVAPPPKAGPPELAPFSEDVDVPPAKPKDRENFVDRATPRPRRVEPVIPPEPRVDPSLGRPEPTPAPRARPDEDVPPPPPDALVPDTVIVRRPHKDFRAPKPEPPPAPGSASKSAKAAEDESIPERLKRRSPTDGDPTKEIKRRVNSVAPLVLLGIGGVVVAAGAIVVVKIVTRSDVEVGTRPPRAIFQGSSGLTTAQEETTASGSEQSQTPSGIASASEDSRAISNVQRYAIDPLRPELGAIPVSQITAAAQPVVKVAIDPLHPERPPVAVVAAPPPAPAPQAARPAPAVVPAVQAPLSAQPPVPAPAAAAAAARPAPPPPAPKKEEWVFEGEVYDVYSLRPVYAAQITFLDGAGKNVTTAVSSSSGRYRAALPAPADGMSSFTVKVEHPDYMPRHVDDIDPPLKTLDEEDRRRIVAAQAIPRPWIGTLKSASRRGIVLVPLNDPATAQ